VEPTEITYRRRLEAQRRAYFGEDLDETPVAGEAHGAPEPVQAVIDAASPSDAEATVDSTEQSGDAVATDAVETAANQEESEVAVTPKRRRKTSTPEVE
jgi:hypothetical protein